MEILLKIWIFFVKKYGKLKFQSGSTAVPTNSRGSLTLVPKPGSLFFQTFGIDHKSDTVLEDKCLLTHRFLATHDCSCLSHSKWQILNWDSTNCQCSKSKQYI